MPTCNEHSQKPRRYIVEDRQANALRWILVDIAAVTTTFTHTDRVVKCLLTQTVYGVKEFNFTVNFDVSMQWWHQSR